jgi:hypothetical protein
MHLRSAHILIALALATPFSQTSADSLQGVSVDVISRSTIQLADRTVTYIRIRPPALPILTSPATISTPMESGAEDRLAELRQAAKPRINIGLGVTVYEGDPVITELTWSAKDGRSFRAFSSVDFTHLSQITELETDSTIYGFFPYFGAGVPSELPNGMREALTANRAQPHYLFEGNEADATAAESTLHALDYLHAYFELNRSELITATAQRKADAAERARLAAIKAAQPKNQTIYFWKNETPPAH